MEAKEHMDRIEELEVHRRIRRKDRDLSSFDYAEGALKRGGIAVLFGVYGVIFGHIVNPELTWLFLLPAAGTAAIALQSFRLTYLDRLDGRKVKSALERKALVDETFGVPIDRTDSRKFDRRKRP